MYTDVQLHCTSQPIHLTSNKQYIKAQWHRVLEKPNIDVDATLKPVKSKARNVLRDNFHETK